MNKKELVEALAKKTGLSQKNVAEVLGAFTEEVTAVLKKGDKLQLVGFGTFSVAERPARTGRNPLTGKAIKVKASKSPKFKAGQSLKDAVNKAKKKK
ncbi:MAG: HU family DNA-binding protein [Lachnospiraceae bacterium]|nr:HU family DNA-binding protein [Lachnospiraceae bacterium]MBR4768457.1 HU family DNA-binding protein [Lachnospiraceae bacterium]